MAERLWTTCGIRLRDLVVVLTLFGHSMIAFGFPLPVPNRTSKAASHPYPCQNRPCGCLTSDLCWKGDCCCFTMEEKLVWAETNRVEPPECVRAPVESREPRPAPPKQKSCCTETEPDVRWQVGLFARKCRGEGPTTAFQLEPSIPADATPTCLAEPERDDCIVPRSDRTAPVPHSPPTPPPRSH